MICRCFMVFVLSLVTLVMLCDAYMNGKCGGVTNRPIECHECNSSINISATVLKHNDTILPMEHSGKDKKCSQDGRFCLKVEEDRKWMTLTMRDPTYAHEGRYDLFITEDNGNIKKTQIYVFVDVCETIITKSDDNLICNVTIKRDFKPSVTWSKENTSYESENIVAYENGIYTSWISTIKQTEKTKKTRMCCNMSFTNRDDQREETQTCQSITDESRMNEEKPGGETVMLPILCVMLLAIVVALYMNRQRMPSTCAKRKNPEEEDMEATQLEKPSGIPENNV